jgi:hypothetical protein
MKKLALLISIAAFAVSCNSPNHDLLIANVNVIDLVTGEVLPNRNVEVRYI